MVDLEVRRIELCPAMVGVERRFGFEQCDRVCVWKWERQCARDALELGTGVEQKLVVIDDHPRFAPSMNHGLDHVEEPEKVRSCRCDLISTLERCGDADRVSEGYDVRCLSIASLEHRFPKGEETGGPRIFEAPDREFVEAVTNAGARRFGKRPEHGVVPGLWWDDARCVPLHVENLEDLLRDFEKRVVFEEADRVLVGDRREEVIAELDPKCSETERRRACSAAMHSYHDDSPVNGGRIHHFSRTSIDSSSQIDSGDHRQSLSIAATLPFK